MSGKPSSTIGFERRYNVAFTGRDRAAFVTAMTESDSSKRAAFSKRGASFPGDPSLARIPIPGTKSPHLARQILEGMPDASAFPRMWLLGRPPNGPPVHCPNSGALLVAKCGSHRRGNRFGFLIGYA